MNSLPLARHEKTPRDARKHRHKRSVQLFSSLHRNGKLANTFHLSCRDPCTYTSSNFYFSCSQILLGATLVERKNKLLFTPSEEETIRKLRKGLKTEHHWAQISPAKPGVHSATGKRYTDWMTPIPYNRQRDRFKTDRLKIDQRQIDRWIDR